MPAFFSTLPALDQERGDIWAGDSTRWRYQDTPQGCNLHCVHDYTSNQKPQMESHTGDALLWLRELRSRESLCPETPHNWPELQSVIGRDPSKVHPVLLPFIMRNHTGTPRCVHQLGTGFPSCRVQALRVRVGLNDCGQWLVGSYSPQEHPLIQGMMYKSGSIQSPSPLSPRRMRC